MFKFISRHDPFWLKGKIAWLTRRLQASGLVRRYRSLRFLATGSGTFRRHGITWLRVALTLAARQHGATGLRIGLTLAAIAMAASFLIWSPSSYLARARAAGTIAPDFLAATSDGQVIQLSAFRGRPVLLNFFATDCLWSQAAVANINAMLESRPDVVVLSVNANRASAAEVQAFAEKYQPQYPLLLDPYGLITNQYRPFRTPFWFFINQAELITAVRIGEHHGYNLVYRVNEFLPQSILLGE